MGLTISIPVGLTISIPVGHTISIPVGLTISIPVGLTISVPVGLTITVPVELTISIPVRLTISIPVGLTISLPVGLTLSITNYTLQIPVGYFYVFPDSIGHASLRLQISMCPFDINHTQVSSRLQGQYIPLCPPTWLEVHGIRNGIT